MRRFRYDQPGFADAFTAFVSERRETPEEVDTIVRDVLAAVDEDNADADAGTEPGDGTDGAETPSADAVSSILSPAK